MVIVRSYEEELYQSRLNSLVDRYREVYPAPSTSLFLRLRLAL